MFILTQDKDMVNTEWTIQTEILNNNDGKVYIHSVNELGSTVLGMYSTRNVAENIINALVSHCKQGDNIFVMPDYE